MKNSLNSTKTFAFLFAIAFLTYGMASAEMVTIAYPTADHPAFTISAPGDWEITQAQEEGGFFDLSGPTGAVLSFRTIEGTEGDLQDAIKESIDFLDENYSNVTLGETKNEKLGGMEALYTTGSGTDEDGKVVFGMAWLALKNGQIAELWFSVAADDKQGAAQCEKILNTFKSK